METIADFEDILTLFERFDVRYLIVGGLAFTFHARPRYTKDIDLWIDPDGENVARANRALEEFGSPDLLDPSQRTEILQIGVAPNRIDVIRELGAADFETSWVRRIEGRYGGAAVLDRHRLPHSDQASDRPSQASGGREDSGDGSGSPVPQGIAALSAPCPGYASRRKNDEGGNSKPSARDADPMSHTLVAFIPASQSEYGSPNIGDTPSSILLLEGEDAPALSISFRW